MDTDFLETPYVLELSEFESQYYDMSNYPLTYVPDSPTMSGNSSSDSPPGSPVQNHMIDYGQADYVNQGYTFMDNALFNQVIPLTDDQIKVEQNYGMDSYMPQYHMMGSVPNISPFAGIPYEPKHYDMLSNPAHASVNLQSQPSKKRKATAPLKKKTPAKKRKTNSDVDLDPNTNNGKISFTRNELLQISSDQFDEYVEKLEKFRKLVKEDKKEIVRQRRLIKNRESAKESRRRKKSHVARLEEKVNRLTEMNNTLQSNYNTVTKENMSLKFELDRMRKTLAENGIVGSVQSGINNVFRPYEEKTVGTLMFVVLLSFGLFFALSANDNSPFSIEDQPEFKPFSERIFTKEDNFKPTGFVAESLTITNPRIKEVFDQNTKSATLVNHDKVSPELSPVHIGSKKANYTLERVEEKFQDIPSSSNTPEMKIEESDDVEMTDVDSSDVDSSEVSENELQQVLQSDIQFQQNTTYLLCERVKYLTSTTGEMEHDPDQPLKLSLYIAGEEGGEEILEVTCQVTDMSHRQLSRVSATS